MTQNFGNLCRELIGGSLSIKNQLVIDSNVNIQNVGNFTAREICVTEGLKVTGNTQLGTLLVPDMVGNLCADKVVVSEIEEKLVDQGITVEGNVFMQNDSHISSNLLLTSNIQATITNGNITVENALITQSNTYMHSHLHMMQDSCIIYGYATDEAVGVATYDYTATVNEKTGQVKMCNVEIPSPTSNNNVTLLLTNNKIKSTSLVQSHVSNYSSNTNEGIPFIWQTNPQNGNVTLIMRNVDFTNTVTNIAQFFINFQVI
jgi:hypothetical protein